ncbi:MAG: 16S rRNA (cytosine(1402)-N(4))-methyltransferase RsmH [Prevotella sp.]|nr:16S rRNA (cytosine(1402)-N(4))-methyltransferase RsmH [Prevotella sp.]
MITTAAAYHIPVLRQESIDGLDVQSDGIYADVTFGGGGHSREILQRLGNRGHLYAFDQDADAEKNIVNDDRFTFVRSNFRYLKNWMRYHGVEQMDGILADLGVSSHHFDDESRGFSFRFDAQLDMRMNRRGGITAAEVVNTYDEQRLSDVFYLYGELKNARRIAATLVKARQQQPIDTTGQLLHVLGIDLNAEGEWTASNAQSSIFNLQSKKEVTRLFQALRIEVNHEMEALKEMLTAATELLRPGGRLVVITYHSLEDRLVKNMMRSGNVEGRAEQDFFGRVAAPLRAIYNKVVTPSEEELAANPRSRSAKLRVAEKVISDK